ncbi:MAG: bifunctional metallophosphatase/5'-nucleotidase [Mycobacteriales bacterium]
MIRTLRRWAVPAVVTALLAGSAAAPHHAAAWTPLTGATVTDGRHHGSTVDVGLLAFNDFHGNIDPPVGSGGLVLGTPAGGVEYLATTVKQLRREHARRHQDVTTVSAGDSIGASPLVSAAFHDEPTIEELTGLGLDVNSVGNHEFDEGVTELLRMQNGGCHPVDGCQDGDGFAGAGFRYLAANVVYKNTGRTIFAPYLVKKYHGVKVGFIGETLKGTAAIVNPAGIQEVNFLDEAATANFWAGKLRREQGVNAFVLLLHQGGQQGVANAPVDGCDNFSGDVVPIVNQLDPRFGLVVSGHTHRYYTCALPNRAGRQTLVTSAGSFGVLVTDITLSLDRRTRTIASATAHNVIVENGVRLADGTWAKNPDGSFVRNADRVDPYAKRLADKYRTAVAPIANKVVGSITADIPSTAGTNGEVPLGDVIADGMLAYTAGNGAQLALMNPGGIRAPLVYANSTGGEAPGQVTFGECFTVQPFNNLVVTVSLTGAQLRSVLEQQFAGFDGQTSTKILQVSAGFTFSYDASAPAGSRVSAVALNGTPIDPAATYRVSTNDFLANGGDGFTDLTKATGRTTAPKFDVDSLTTYLGAHSPVAPGPADRITKLG